MKMSRTTKQEEETMEFPVDEFTMPSNFARKHVLRHSREAREAVANTSEASATQSNHAVGLKAPVVPPPDFTGVGKVPESLRPFVVYPNADEEIIGVSNAAERLAISRTTVYEWAKTNKLIAWRVAKRVLRIPAKQIINKGHVVPGLKDVVLAIGDPELA